MYKVLPFAEVEDDLAFLQDEILDEVMDYFEKYKTNPYKYSKPLYSQGDMKLQGYRKTYVANATYRIVIQIENKVAKIVEVIAVGSRKDKQIYLEANSRINK